MANNLFSRTFKTNLNTLKSIVFDYGVVNSLPQIGDADFSIACICFFDGYYFIKNKNSSNWNKLKCRKFLYNVKNNISDENNNYYWYNEIVRETNGEIIGTINNTNHLFLYNHNLNDMVNCQVYMATNPIEDLFDFSNYQKIQLPYQNIDNNNLAIDFSGFTDVGLYFYIYFF